MFRFLRLHPLLTLNRFTIPYIVSLRGVFLSFRSYCDTGGKVLVCAVLQGHVCDGESGMLKKLFVILFNSLQSRFPKLT